MTADVTREPTGAQGLLDELVRVTLDWAWEPGIVPTDAQRQILRDTFRLLPELAALIADADNWRRVTTGDPTEPEPLAMQARELLVRNRELEATVARVREVVADLESFVVARGYPATGTYDDGLTRAQAATAADLRAALDGEPQP